MIVGRFGVDLNGGLVNSFEGKRKALIAVTGRRIGSEWFAGKHVVEEGTLFPSLDCTASAAPITAAEYQEAMRRYYETDKFFEWSELMPGALEVLSRLADRGCEIRIVSSVLGLDDGRVWALIQKYRLPVSQVIATRKKPKTAHYDECDAVVDNEVGHLLSVRDRTVRILLFPSEGTTGYRRITPPKEMPAGILSAVGWEKAARYLIGTPVTLH